MESSSDETDHHHGRSYECVFCKRGFTTAQALGGHMNIHRKDKANNNKSTKPNTYPSGSTKVVVDDDDDDDNNKSYADHGFYSAINPTHLVARGNNTNHCSTAPSHRDWRQRSLSPLCVGEAKDKVQDNINEEDGLDLELRLGHYP